MSGTRASRHDLRRGRRAALAAGVPGRPVRDPAARAASAPRRPRPAASRTSPATRSCRCAGRCRSCAPIRGRGLDRDPLQDRRPRPRGAVASSRWAPSISVLGPIGNGFTAVARAPAHAARRRRRRHPADGVPRRVAQGAPRRRLAAAGADGLGDSVPVPRAAVDDPRARHAGRRDRLHAAARRLGRAEPARDAGGLPRLLRRLRDRPRRARGCRRSTRRRSPRSRCSPADRRRCCRPPRASRAASACPARCRSRSSWPARSAAAPAARCRWSPSPGSAMKRVCVDGPVFDANAVFPPAA